MVYVRPSESTIGVLSFHGQRIAMRNADGLYWMHGDHLGSTAITTNDLGAKESELRYNPYGLIRSTSGALPTDKRFTGQMLDESTGLYFYNARYYDPALGRFIQTDTVVAEPWPGRTKRVSLETLFWSRGQNADFERDDQR